MERLQKVLAQAGIASRRKCEQIILAGRVEVNDEIVSELGTKVDVTEDIIKVDGKPIRSEEKIYLMFHKPKGVISSISDPEGRKVVTDYLTKVKQRVYPIGRLDYDTEGLLLLTNDGEFSNMLMHPKYKIPKHYHAVVKGVPHGNDLEKLRQGIMLEGKMTAPAEVEYADVQPDMSQSVISIIIHEGRNRQVRKMLEHIRADVLKLRRVNYGPLSLQGLSRGKYRHLSEQEVKSMKKLASKSH
ncbi:pseudouridine synthase [Longirhabdus pacifica]|uniref:pseudouridine synthase n=1 Tax=Longirhabdus pacifica TaxID=2305227 RepID=UPI0010093339|nr:pseudouridine synthase [Longirhabdus pacifica]